MSDKKKVLLCVVPEEIYVDVHMKTWYHFTNGTGGRCSICGGTFDDEDGYCSTDEKFRIHDNDICVRNTLPSEMFAHFEWKYHSVQHLMSRFGDMLCNMQVEFLMHMERKGDSWQHCDLYDLLFPLIRVFMKFIAVDHNDIESSYDEMIDLGLMCLMLGTRYGEVIKANEDREKT